MVEFEARITVRRPLHKGKKYDIISEESRLLIKTELDLKFPLYPHLFVRK